MTSPVSRPRRGAARTRLTRRGRIVVAVALVLAVTPPLIAAARGRAARIEVRFGRRTYRVAAGSTVQSLVDRLGIRLPAGDLLDVHGAVLARGVVPATFLVDGRPSGPETRLAAGDVVVARPATDHREPLRRSVIQVDAGTPPDPQFSLIGTPGREIVTSGGVSHEIVSAVFRPIGPAREPPAVALTFDDGPGAYTQRILETLRRYRAPATFFVVGVRAAQYPHVILEERRSGMAIGNHSWDHPNSPPFAKLRPARIRWEIRRADDVLASLGVVPALFRPPGGSFSRTVVEAAREVDARVALWDVDPKDWRRGQTAARIASSVLRAVHPGAIVELHDGGGNRSATARALPAIIRGIRAMGLRLVTLDP